METLVLVRLTVQIDTTRPERPVWVLKDGRRVGLRPDQLAALRQEAADLRALQGCEVKLR